MLPKLSSLQHRGYFACRASFILDHPATHLLSTMLLIQFIHTALSFVLMSSVLMSSLLRSLNDSPPPDLAGSHEYLPYILLVLFLSHALVLGLLSLSPPPHIYRCPRTSTRLKLTARFASFVLGVYSFQVVPPLFA